MKVTGAKRAALSVSFSSTEKWGVQKTKERKELSAGPAGGQTRESEGERELESTATILHLHSSDKLSSLPSSPFLSDENVEGSHALLFTHEQERMMDDVQALERTSSAS